MNAVAAAEYAERHALQALVIEREGRRVFERFAPGFDDAAPHALYSGTKSFWGVAAVAAQCDGLLDLDERVGATFETWTQGAKNRVTLRHLLQLTSGIGFGGLGRAVPEYVAALAVELKAEPGERFTYGGIPLQVFGAVLAEKLRPGGQTPHTYLYERLCAPIGMQIGSWRALRDGTQPLPTGAFVAAAQWAKFGRFVLQRGMWDDVALLPSRDVAACFEGSAANPRYGLGWWLSPLASVPDLVYASGSGGQALYVIPSENAVVVKFGKSASYGHEPFLKRLLS
ncbi:MAG: serine hydrolase [Candidatus Eremiobacteraeota bacterium]|nr:serine hydrolase [Candidatus Eremiobacteraeota bacterium]